MVLEGDIRIKNKVLTGNNHKFSPLAFGETNESIGEALRCGRTATPRTRICERSEQIEDFSEISKLLTENKGYDSKSMYFYAKT